MTNFEPSPLATIAIVGCPCLILAVLAVLTATLRCFLLQRRRNARVAANEYIEVIIHNQRIQSLSGSLLEVSIPSADLHESYGSEKLRSASPSCSSLHLMPNRPVTLTFTPDAGPPSDIQLVLTPPSPPKASKFAVEDPYESA